ncbi:MULTISPECIES: hypothetical protein [unclassified Janthinobacterium]|uniref:hypothetical protein n=1 Tax=unclassified Janthinobacterium TaxID=2610881 RepID=UPI0012F7FB6C|nr:MULTISPECIES: hypothetical protein [unclassified Janthinobacterium]MEC5160386.1 hypothetical protein [Janthinobacterium sp. CG_S6]
MKEPKASTEIFELNKLVQVSIPMKSVQWEILMWPYDDGFLPSSTELITLVAEFEPSDPKWFGTAKEPIKPHRLAPEAGRAWMSPQFKTLLAAEYLDTTKYNCTGYNSKLIKSGDPIDGFVCESGGRGFLYLRLADYSPQVEPASNVTPAPPETKQIKITEK